MKKIILLFILLINCININANNLKIESFKVIGLGVNTNYDNVIDGREYEHNIKDSLYYDIIYDSESNIIMIKSKLNNSKCKVVTIKNVNVTIKKIENRNDFWNIKRIGNDNIIISIDIKNNVGCIYYFNKKYFPY